MIWASGEIPFESLAFIGCHGMAEHIVDQSMGQKKLNKYDAAQRVR